MKIELTPEQYQQLLEMVYLGEWMINACRKPEDVIEKYRDLEQHVFSFAKENGLERYVDYDEKTKTHYPSQELEMGSDAEEYRLEFEEETFWDELTERLSLRDAVDQHGEAELEKRNGIEQYKLQWPFMERYQTEFEKHEIGHLRIVSNRIEKKKP